MKLSGAGTDIFRENWVNIKVNDDHINDGMKCTISLFLINDITIYEMQVISCHYSLSVQPISLAIFSSNNGFVENTMIALVENWQIVQWSANYQTPLTSNWVAIDWSRLTDIYLMGETRDVDNDSNKYTIRSRVIN